MMQSLKKILGFKNDARDLVNFNASSGKSKNLQFDLLLLSIAYVSWKMADEFKNDMRN